MAPAESAPPEQTTRTSGKHIVRTTVAAIASLLVARAAALPEPYWATVTTLVVMQSSLGASWVVSWKRLAGTALGALVGGALGSLMAPSALAFTAAVFATGWICFALKLDRTAYRFTGITLAIVMLVARRQPPWLIAAHRFAEVSIGIAVALVLAAAWPESGPSSANRKTATRAATTS